MGVNIRAPCWEAALHVIETIKLTKVKTRLVNTEVKIIGPRDLISQTPTPDCVFGAALKRLDVRSRVTEIDVQGVSQEGADGAGTPRPQYWEGPLAKSRKAALI